MPQGFGGGGGWVVLELASTYQKQLIAGKNHLISIVPYESATLAAVFQQNRNLHI